MSLHSDNKLINNDVVKGKVRSLRNLYESKSESFLFNDEHMKASTNIKTSIEDIYTKATKQSPTVFKSENQYSSKNKFKKLQKRKSASRKNEPKVDTKPKIVGTHPSNRDIVSNKAGRNDGLVTKPGIKSEIKADITNPSKNPTMSKKPIPAPRAHAPPSKEESSELNKTPQEDQTFIEATELGTVETLRKSLLHLIDKKMKEMRQDGYTIFKSDDIEEESEDEFESDEEDYREPNNENLDQNDSIDEDDENYEDNEDVESQDDLSETQDEVTLRKPQRKITEQHREAMEDEIPEEQFYTNLLELLGYKDIKQNKRFNLYRNSKELGNQSTKDPSYEDIDQNCLNGVKNQDASSESNLEDVTLRKINLKADTTAQSLEEKVTREPIYENLLELLGNTVKQKGNGRYTLEDYDELIKQLSRYTISKNMDNIPFKDNKGKHLDLNLKKEMNWNIPPMPERSLKPNKYLDQVKEEVACSMKYDQTDDENFYDMVDDSIVEMRSKRISKEETQKNDQLECENQAFTQNMQLTKIVQEFKATEARYIQELKDIIPVFKYGIKNHSSLTIRSKAGLICSTVDKLLELQSEFARMVDKSEDYIKNILHIFLDFDELFITYKQCLGTNEIINVTITLGYTEDDLQTEINLTSVLNQRLTHYQMFLERIRTEILKRRNSTMLQMALHPLNSLMEILNSCNTMLLLATVKNIPLKTDNYGSLNDLRETPASHFVKCCPFDVSGYGDFLLQDRFKVKKPFSTELVVFLFNNIILFTMEKQKDTFFYHSHIKMNDVLLRPLQKRDALEFQHFVKSKQFHSPTNYKLRADPKIVFKWRKHINDCLWTQKLKIKEEVEQYKKTVSTFYIQT